MRSRPAHRESNSLNTFFIYTVIVLGLIFLSLSVRVFYLFQNSIFDGKHQLVIALGEEQQVKEIVAFDPREQAVTILKLQGESVRFSSLGKELSILPNATVDTKGKVSLDDDISSTMLGLLIHYYTIKTNLTIFDVTQLFFISRKATLRNQEIKEMTVSEDTDINNKFIANLFVDDAIFSENVSIQVVNASGEPGIGKRLERVLTNRGGNVVSVSTSRETQKSSKIQYFGEETYTLTTIKKLLGFSTEQFEKEAIADIIITIGEDQKNSSSF